VLILATDHAGARHHDRQHRAAVYSRQRLASRHRPCQSWAGTGDVNVTTPAVPAKRLTDIGADYFAWADGGKTITWAVARAFSRTSQCHLFEPPKDERKRATKRRRQEKQLTPRLDKNGRDKKDAASQTADAKKDERRIKTKTRKKKKRS